MGEEQEVQRDQGRRRVWGVTAGLISAFIALDPIRNYDYFWHLATGRWIVSHRAIPRHDPFSLTGAGQDWINLEWLFDLVTFELHSLLGHVGLTVLVALSVGAVAAILVFGIRLSPPLGAAVTLLCVVAALFRIDVRPETASVVPFLIVCLLALSPATRPRMIIATVVTIVWINIHPSALLAPMIIGAAFVHELLEWGPSGKRMNRGLQLVGVVVALLVNPWGLRGVLAPFGLAGQLETGVGFQNLEWRWSDPSMFPLFWVILIGSAIVMVARFRMSDLTRTLLFVGFAVLAVRYGRNQIYFLSALPLLLPSLRFEGRKAVVLTSALLTVAIGAVGWSLLADPPEVGVEESMFPVDTTEIIARNSLKGNIYNPDQFGGYLIWHFPVRRVLTDGRNELNRDYIPRLRDALRDQRLWDDLLNDYEIDIAIEEYRPPLEVVDAATGSKRLVPSSVAFFPRSRWALVGYDEASLLFLRRSAFDPALIERLEIRDVVPDSPEALARIIHERSTTEA